MSKQTEDFEDFQDSDRFFSLDAEAQRKWLDDHYEADLQDQRARAVIDLVQAQWETLDLNWESKEAELEAHMQRQDVEMAECLAKNLDVKSLWTFICQAHRYIEGNRNRLRAGTRHAENRAMKAEVFSWLDQHMGDYKSLDSAAEAIAGKGWPIKWRTARDWVGQWKALRSAGKP